MPLPGSRPMQRKGIPHGVGGVDRAVPPLTPLTPCEICDVGPYTGGWVERYDLAVIGGGTAGLVSAAVSAGIGAKTALIEQHKLGGECLWTGCVPSKAIIRSASVLHTLRHAAE